MAKFYVESGSLRGIVDCYDEMCAAVWAIQRAMEKSAIISQELDGDTESIGDAMFELDDSIRINERGFDRDDCLEIELHDAFVHWHQLKKAIDAISRSWEDKLGE